MLQGWRRSPLRFYHDRCEVIRMRDAADHSELASPEVQRRRIFITLIAISVTAALLAIAAPFALRWLTRKGTAIHHRSITRSLAEWEQEDSQIRTPEDAEHARGMLEYIRGYYPVGPGNRSDLETEAALEAQRAKTLRTIKAALDEYESSAEDLSAPQS
jgi:hypothetical protein